MMSCNVLTNSGSSSIRNAALQTMILNTLEYEKPVPAFIGIEELKAIATLIRPIKARIEAATNGSIPGSFAASLAVGSNAPFSQAGSAHFASYQGQ